MLDFLIKGARYPDFKDNLFKIANIGLKDGKIRFIGQEEPRSLKNLEADGKILSPGFIDRHMHEENFQNEGEKYVIAEAMLQMGVTTAVGGNCGIQRQSIKPVSYTHLDVYKRQIMSQAISSSIITLKSPSLKLEKILLIQDELFSIVSGLDTMTKPIRDDRIKASRILLVTKMYTIKNMAGTKEKAPYSDTSDGNTLVKPIVIIKTKAIIIRVRLLLKAAFSLSLIHI